MRTTANRKGNSPRWLVDFLARCDQQKRNKAVEVWMATWFRPLVILVGALAAMFIVGCELIRKGVIG